MIVHLVFVFLFAIIGLNESAFAQARSSFMVKVLADRVAVRSGPNVNFETVAVVSKSTTLVVLSSDYGWNKVKLPPEAKAYIKKDYVRQISEDVAEIQADRVNVRCAPSTEATVIGKVERGRRLYTLAIEGDWLVIKPFDELFGWVKKELVEPLDRVAVPARLFPVPPPGDVSVPVPSVVPGKVPVGAPLEIRGVLGKDGDRYILKQDAGISFQLNGPDALLNGFVGSQVSVTGKELLSSSDAPQALRIIKISKINRVF